jgi:hypothetical protein
MQGGSWTETTIHTFGGGNDGATPGAGLIFDSLGTLYGTTYGGGGIGQCESAGGCGTVFELSPPTTQGGAWSETVLHSFTGGADGGGANASVVMDSTGNLGRRGGLQRWRDCVRVAATDKGVALCCAL